MCVCVGGGGGGGSLSLPRLNIFTVGNMGVMICLGQGGLRFLSASSFFFFFFFFFFFKSALASLLSTTDWKSIQYSTVGFVAAIQ